MLKHPYPLKANFVTAEDVAEAIEDNSTICTIAMTLVSSSESNLTAIEEHFLKTGHPRGLTLLHSCGQSDRERGIQHLAHEGLVTKIIGSHWGLQPKWMDLISNNKVIAYCVPQGQIAQMYRSMACGLPGKISKVGLGTFVDPRIEGGKMNDLTSSEPNISEVISLCGEEYMFYHAVPIDYLFIRGTTCDEMGNLTTTEEAMKLEVFSAVLAAKRYGGKVIAQVKNVAETGTLPPKEITVPGIFIDAIVVCQNPESDHRMTSSFYYDPSYIGQLRTPISSIERRELDIRKFIARRGCEELIPGCSVNLGTGIPNDMVGQVCAEEDICSRVMLTVESGIYGGIQKGGIDFGIGKNLIAMVPHAEQFDFYDGMGVDITYMGFGELDELGNVNSTKMGNKCAGAGGFIDITQNAKMVIFLGTFTAQGISCKFSDSKLTISREGSIKKMVRRVSQISFNGALARAEGQKVLIVTERAVFQLVAEGIKLIEIAPGVDLQHDILDQMEFIPIISEHLKLMEPSLFEEDCNLKRYLYKN